jgi:SAM-dependent methyltransferase
MTEHAPQLPAEYFERQDESDDEWFYTSSRLVVHIDDRAIAATTQLFRELLPAEGSILDLMSSWRSHLPPEHRYARVAGLGMNADELRENGQLTEHTVQNLNKNPRLPFQDASFDGCVCTVSVQYLTRPVEVFAEVARVLRFGAPFVVVFSNRMFPTKAVAVWRSLDDQGHVNLVAEYFRRAGGFTDPQAVDASPRRWGSDPLFAVVGRRAELTLNENTGLRSTN